MNVMKLEELARLIREAIQTQGLLHKDIAAHCGIDYDAFMGYTTPPKVALVTEGLPPSSAEADATSLEREAQLLPPTQRRTRRSSHE